MSSFEHEELAPTSERRGRGWIAGAFILLVLSGLYFGAALFFGDKVPSSTTVGGVEIGGMSESEARTALEEGLADDEAREITVKGEKKSFTLTPAEAGLRYDYDESLAGLTGFSANPADLFAHVTGGTDRPVEVAVDEEALAAAVDTGAAELERKATEGKVSLDGDQVEVKKSVAGNAVDREAVVTQVTDGWPSRLEFSAPESSVEPTLTQKEIDRFVKDDLEPLVAGPVTIRTTDPGKGGASKAVSFSVPADELAAAISVKDDKGALSAQIDDAKLSAAVVSAGTSDGALRAATDATVERTSGRSFRVVSSKNGLGLDEDKIAEPVREAMTKEGSARRAEVASTETKPELTTAEAKKTVPKEVISTFSTNLTDNADRTENIVTAARTIDGTYVAPGETFSLNEALGQRTAAKGYNKAPVIINGRLRQDYGGGISQLSTTLFNAIFFSGAKIEEFHPHSFYIARYPEGREATISWPDVDNRFTNDTGAGIVIETSTSGGKVSVTFYGRKRYDEVEAVKGARQNVVQPKKIKDDSEGCVPQSPSPGFDVTITRIFKDGGREVNRSSFTTHYIPEDEVTCT